MCLLFNDFRFLLKVHFHFRLTYQLDLRYSARSDTDQNFSFYHLDHRSFEHLFSNLHDKFSSFLIYSAITDSYQSNLDLSVDYKSSLKSPTALRLIIGSYSN